MVYEDCECLQSLHIDQHYLFSDLHVLRYFPNGFGTLLITLILSIRSCLTITNSIILAIQTYGLQTCISIGCIFSQYFNHVFVLFFWKVGKSIF